MGSSRQSRAAGRKRRLIFSNQSMTVIEGSPEANNPSIIQKVVREMRAKKII